MGFGISHFDVSKKLKNNTDLHLKNYNPFSMNEIFAKIVKKRTDSKERGGVLRPSY